MEWPVRFDPVNVLMEVEDKFGIKVSWNEDEEVRTLGQLHDLVLAKVGWRPDYACVSSATFYRLRKVLGEEFSILRDRVRTTSPLEEFVPLHGRNRHWQKLCAALGDAQLPATRRPWWLRQLLDIAFLIGLALPGLSGAMLYKLGGYPPALWGTLMASSIPLAILVRWAGNRLTREWEICIPPGCTTIRDLVYTVVAQKGGPVVSESDRPSDAEIWSILCGIVGDEFDIQPTSLSKTSHPWSP